MFAALATAVLLLQQAPGATLAGRVLDADGTPVANATVTLLHRPIARHIDPEREHRIVVATDARGAFRATLRDGATYSVWAASAEQASQLAEGIGGGGFVELSLDTHTGPRTVAVAGLDAWSDAATFGFRALVGGENLDLVPVRCRDGQLELPALPPLEIRTIEVLAGDGRVLWAGRALPDSDASTLQLPPPVTYEVRVTDTAGAAIAGVEILAHILNYWGTQSSGMLFGDRFRSLWPSQGRTDANGRLTMRVAASASGTSRQWLLAKKDGFAMSLDGVHDGKRFRAGKELPADEQPRAEDPITVVLQAAAPQVLPLRQENGTAVAVDTLFLVTRVRVAKAGGGTGTPFVVAAPIADGEVVLRSPPPAGTDAELAWTTLAPGLRDALRARHGFAPPAPFRLPRPQGLLAAPAPQFDARQWHAVHVIAADGRPAAHTVVQVRDAADKRGVLLRTDRLGRVAFERRTTTHVSVFARTGVGTAVILADEKSPTNVALRAVQPATGRVVDAGGHAVAGVIVTARVRASGDGPEGAAELEVLSSLLPSAPSDADGRFEVLLPPFPAEVQVAAAATARKMHTTSTIAWDPGAPAAPIEIVLDGK